MIAQIRCALRHGQSQRGRLHRRDPLQMRNAQIAGVCQCRVQAVQIDAGSGRPHREHERQFGPAAPFITQVPDLGEPGRGGMDSPIADQQHGVGRRVFERGPDRQRPQQGRKAIALAEQNSDQGGAGARAFVERQRPDPLGRHAAEQLHAQHRPAAGDAGVGNDAIVGMLEKLDRRNQGHIEFAGGQLIGQAARQIENHFRLRSQPLQAIDQRLGIQIIDGPNAEPGGGWHVRWFQSAT